MDTDMKDTFDSLNTKINLYKDSLEIVEGILDLYKTFFNLKDEEGRERNFIIDCGTYIVERYKKQWINIFDNIIVFEAIPMKVEIKDIKVEAFNYIVQGMERCFLREYEILLESWNLEVGTFRERNENIKNIEIYSFQQSKEEIQNFNMENIKKIIEAMGEVVNVELNELIESFNKTILVEKEDLRYFIKHRESMDLIAFNTEVALIRETVLSKVEEFQEKLKELIEKKLVKESLELINHDVEVKMNSIIGVYREEINKLYVSTMNLKGKTITCICNNRFISKDLAHRKCGLIINEEVKYIGLVRNIAVEGFRVLEQESKAILSNIFNLEFYSALYDLKLPGDIKNLIEGYKIKGNFILRAVMLDLLKKFIDRYKEIIILKLRDRKNRIEKLYIFKPITYMGQVSVYEPSLIVDIQELLIDIYEGYNFEANKNQELNKIKRVYIGLNKDVEKITETFNSALEDIEVRHYMNDSFHEKKVKLYIVVKDLEREMWRTLNSRFINIFNGINNMIRINMEQMEIEITFYENNIEYQD